MRFLIFSVVSCVLSFSLAGAFYGSAGFDKLTRDYKTGKFNFHFDSGSGQGFGEKVERFKPAKVKKVVINSALSELDIKVGDVQNIKLKVKFLNSESAESYKTNLKEGVLFIDMGDENEHKGFSSLFKNMRGGSEIDLTVPKSFVADYEFKMALGELDIKGIKAGVLKAKIAAGDIDITDVELESGSVDAAAGDIDLKKVTAREGFKIKAAAGDVDVEMNQESPNVKIMSAAGDIDFSITKGVEPNLVFTNSSTVGELSVREGYISKSENGERYVFGEGKGEVVIKTTFGDVDFK